MKRVLVIASVLIFSLALISGAMAEDIKVGTLMPSTGPLKEFGPNCENGVKLAAKQMAAAGFSIKLIHEDSETSAIPATDAAKKLVEIDRVVAIIGALASGVTVPVAESVTSPSNVIMISPASTSPLITVLPADYAKDFLFPGGAFDNRTFFGQSVSFSSKLVEFEQMLLYDPQTSGGLLLSIPQEKVEAFLSEAKRIKQPIWVIGEVVEGKGIEVL